MSERKRIPIGVNAIVVRDGMILLGERFNCFGAGTWGLPGGHLEDRESMIDAVARELLEETGIVASGFTFSNIVNCRNNDVDNEHYLQVAFVADGFNGEARLCEPNRCKRWEWHDLNSLPDNIFFAHADQIDLYRNSERFIDN